jgi:TIR domain
MPLVFISYNRKDGKYAKSLRDQIAARGIDVFFDIDSIAPSVAFPTATADSIAKCDLFLLLWSHNAAASHFVQEELNIALAEKKVIFPVMLDDCPRPAALSAINSMNGPTPMQVANRVVGVILKEDHLPTTRENPNRKSRFRSWLVKISIAITILCIALFLPAAITWDARISWPQVPSDSVIVEPPKTTVSTLPEPTHSAKKTALSGTIYDAENSQLLLEGIEVCIRGETKGQNFTPSICTKTDRLGNYALSLNVAKLIRIELIIDGRNAGYQIRRLQLNPNGKIQGLQYSLKKL